MIASSGLFWKEQQMRTNLANPSVLELKELTSKLHYDKAVPQ